MKYGISRSLWMSIVPTILTNLSFSLYKTSSDSQSELHTSISTSSLICTHLNVSSSYSLRRISRSLTIVSLSEVFYRHLFRIELMYLSTIMTDIDINPDLGFSGEAESFLCTMSVEIIPKMKFWPLSEE